jgi:hypothetical protein
MIAVATTLALVSISFLNSRLGVQRAQRAQTVANAGAQDALIQLSRNKDFATSSYVFVLDTNTATVSVTQNTPVSGQATIVSSARVSNYVRKTQVVVAVDQTSGQIVMLSWQLVQ